MRRGPQRLKKLAFLALALRWHHDELYADFYQTYGVDTWDTLESLGWDDDPRPSLLMRMAALAYQLAPDSRTRAAMNPAASHSTEALLLRQMELNQRAWAWAHTKDGERGENEPEPIWLTGEEQEHERMVEREENKALTVADALGISI